MSGEPTTPPRLTPSPTSISSGPFRTPSPSSSEQSDHSDGSADFELDVPSEFNFNCHGLPASILGSLRRILDTIDLNLIRVRDERTERAVEHLHVLLLFCHHLLRLRIRRFRQFLSNNDTLHVYTRDNNSNPEDFSGPNSEEE